MYKLVILFLSVTTLASAQSPADTLDRGFFTEVTYSPQYRSSLSIGGYEKINIGEHFHAIMDIQIMYDGLDVYDKLRVGVGARFDNLQTLVFMPELNQKNWGTYNTPWCIEFVVDKKYLRFAASCEIYPDRAILSMKVRVQINTSRPRSNVKVRN